MATARLAACWPTMWQSSSETISWGVMADIFKAKSGSGAYLAKAPTAIKTKKNEKRFTGFDGVVHVGIDAQLTSDFERLFSQSRARSARCVPAALWLLSGHKPPEPVATMPCSGSNTSPLPVMMNEAVASATASMASRRRSTRSVRQSRVSSMAARAKWPWCFPVWPQSARTR